MTIDPDDLRLSPTAAESFRAVFEKRLSRRSVLRAASLAAASATLPALTACSDGADPVAPVEPLDSVEAEAIFTELAHGLDENFHVAPGYNAQVLVRWGDPIFSDAPEFDPLNQQPESQAKQFGFNNDYTGFVPLPLGSDNSDHGLLVVNHEYTDATNMHPGSPARIELNEVQTEIDRLAHGLSVIEIKKTDGQWRLVKDSAYNRRITPYTEMQISGPAAGSERMKSLYSEDGIKTYALTATAPVVSLLGAQFLRVKRIFKVTLQVSSQKVTLSARQTISALVFRKPPFGRLGQGMAIAGIWPPTPMNLCM